MNKETRQFILGFWNYIIGILSLTYFSVQLNEYGNLDWYMYIMFITGLYLCWDGHTSMKKANE